MKKNYNKKTPTTVFTGFLGSGKTTIISNLVDELISQGKKPVYIKNEIGNEDIDGKILEGKNIKTKELLNGCICCTLVGPFANAIDEIVSDINPDRIIIEASGAADPSAIALMVSSHQSLIRDGVVTIVDVDNFEGYKDLSETARNQARFTDLVVFNKVELVSIDKKRAVVGYVRELNEHSPIVEAPNGKIAANLVFGVSSIELNELLEHNDEKNEDEHSHLEADSLETFYCEVKNEISKEKLRTFLESLPKNLIRVKGFVILEGGDRQLVNKVGKRVNYLDVEETDKPEDQKSILVFIGFNIIQYEKKIKEEIKDSLYAR